MWREAGTPKPVFAYMLEAELAQWQQFKWSLDATAHVDRPAAHGAQLAQRRGALRKAAINSLIGLFARNLELVYSMKTSNHQVDGEGCSCTMLVATGLCVVFDIATCLT